MLQQKSLCIVYPSNIQCVEGTWATAGHGIQPFVKKCEEQWLRFQFRFYTFVFILLTVPFMSLDVHAQSNSFRSAQKEYSRVRAAYADKEAVVNSWLEEAGISRSKLRIYVRALKVEGLLQVFAANEGDADYQLLQTYSFCSSSGTLGPKSKQGDYQIPEGCYTVDRFNPQSTFHLSLGVNYPNHADRKRSTHSNLGGDIFIHGNCVTVGCIPITDDKIQELYLLAVEAKNAGQRNISVHFFPAAMTKENFDLLQKVERVDDSILELWRELKVVWDAFDREHTPPQVSIDREGRYVVR